MRIAFDVSYIHRDSAGIGQAASGLLSALLEFDQSNQYLLHGWSRSLDLQALATLQSARVATSLHRIPGPIKRFYWNHMHHPQVERFTGAFDIFHSADPFLPPTRLPAIVTLHDLYSFEHPEWFEKRVVLRHPQLLRSLQKADAIVVPSDCTYRQLESLNADFARKAIEVHWPIRKAFGPKDPDGRDRNRLRSLWIDSPFILCVGTIEPRKNVGRLLLAFQQLSHSLSGPLKLLIVGKAGWKSDELVRRLRSAAKTEGIRYLEYVPDTTLAALYRNATVVVYPSLGEGFGLPVLEAFSCGAAVVTSDVPALRELWGDSTYLVNPEDAESIAAGIRAVAEDPALRSSLRDKGLQKAQSMNPEVAAEKIIGLYRRLAEVK